MPKNKTPMSVSSRVRLNRRECEQILKSLGSSHDPAATCVCSPQAIFRLISKGEPVLCAEMPWKCPKQEHEHLDDDNPHVVIRGYIPRERGASETSS